ncbi:MAG: NAD(P)H-hydrate dehydratase [Clostridiales Family XIII bacterium]|jgi:NAD(P)H-hydrate epimerase|nr:NAD(P)H-hydrate dehydratase [Clostridiales Family XIII bacterium]
MDTITKNEVKNVLKKRHRNIHKGDCGRVLIVAGSPGMAGAAALGAMGALRSGAGLVTVSIDETLFPIVQSLVPCATCVTRAAIEEDIERWDAIAIGPGLGTDEGAVKTLESVLGAYAGIAVIDADALNIMAARGLDLRKSAVRAIFTPHAGEAARLLGTEPRAIESDRADAACALAERFHAIAVLKGSETLVASPDGNTSVNPTGNPGMATGGSGDVLSGVIASFAGQGFGARAAARAGVYIHGLAGDIKADEIGEYGLIATDIADTLPKAIQTVNHG